MMVSTITAPKVRANVVAASLLALLVVSAPSAAADKLLVSGYTSDSVLRYNLQTDIVLGTLTGAALDGPQATVVGPNGWIYLADEENDRVLRFDPQTSSYLDEFIAPGAAGLDGPTGLLFTPDGDLLVASFNTDAILIYDGETGAPFPDPFVAPSSGSLNGPDVGMAYGPDGHLYVPSFWNNRIIRYDGATGAFIDTFVIGGLAVLPQPRTIIFRPDGFMYVTSDSGNKVVRFDASDGTFDSDFVAAGTGGLNGASGMVFADDGFLYITSWRSNQVLRFDATSGSFVDVAIGAASGVVGPTFVSLLKDPPPPIPATSEWGLVILFLSLLVAGSAALQRWSAVDGRMGG